MTRMNGQTVRYCADCGEWHTTVRTRDIYKCQKCGNVQRICKCNRCGAEWKLRRTEYPMNCTKCKSPYYNTKRIQDRT